MVTPVRYTSGFTQDAPWQPLGRMGAPNPFFYHQAFDDFNSLDTTMYTTTATTAGTVALAAVDGGAILFTTNASTPLATDIASVQLKAACFQNVAPKKMFFFTRIRLGNITNPAFVAGLMNTTVTPFAATDGIYFSKATASTTINLVTVVGSVATTTPIVFPAAFFANATDIDLGFEVTSGGDIVISVGNGLVGYLPQSGTGASSNTRSPIQRVSGATITTVVLNPTLAIQSGTAASQTLQADFILAARER